MLLSEVLLLSCRAACRLAASADKSADVPGCCFCNQLPPAPLRGTQCPLCCEGRAQPRPPKESEAGGCAGADSGTPSAAQRRPSSSRPRLAGADQGAAGREGVGRGGGELLQSRGLVA